MQGKQDAVLVLKTHHSIMDGSSLQVAMRDLAALYQALSSGQPAELPECTIQYSDFAQWQHSQQETGAWEPHMQFWKQHLEGAPDALDLPADVCESGKTQSRESHWLQLRFDAEESEAIRGLATRCQTSLLALVIATIQVRVMLMLRMRAVMIYYIVYNSLLWDMRIGRSSCHTDVCASSRLMDTDVAFRIMAAAEQARRFHPSAVYTVEIRQHMFVLVVSLCIVSIRASSGRWCWQDDVVDGLPYNLSTSWIKSICLDLLSCRWCWGGGAGKSMW